MSQSWEALRKEARRLETEIDAKLVEYSKIVASLQTTSATTRTSFETVHASTEGKSGLVESLFQLTVLRRACYDDFSVVNAV